MMNRVTIKKTASGAFPAFVFCCVVTLFISLHCPGQRMPGQDRRAVLKPGAQNEKGRNLILDGRIDEAIVSYAPLAKNSTNRTLIAEYAYALALRGIYDAALINLDRVESAQNDPDVNYFIAQVFTLMGYDDIAGEFWQPATGNVPSWIVLNASRLQEKYQRKSHGSGKPGREELIAEFKQANELVTYHSYLRSIALFHHVTDHYPNEYLPFAGYSIALEKIGALERSEEAIKRAINIVGSNPDNAEKRQFLQQRLDAIRAKKAQMVPGSAPRAGKRKPDGSRAQMMIYAGAAFTPSYYIGNLKFGYYIMDKTNASVNCNVMNNPGGSSTVNLGLSVYSTVKAFVSGVGLQYSTAGYSSVQYSVGFRIKPKKNKNETDDIFLDVNQGLTEGSPITWNLSIGMSLYFGKRSKK